MLCELTLMDFMEASDRSTTFVAVDGFFSKPFFAFRYGRTRSRSRFLPVRMRVA